MMRRSERGVSMLEVSVYTGLLGFLMLSFFSVMSAATRAQREVVDGAQARLEAERIYEVVAAEIASASLATVTSPAPAGSASGASFQRVSGIAEDPVTGVPVAVVEQDVVTIALDPSGLTRAQRGVQVTLSPRVTELVVERLGSSRAIRVRLAVVCPTQEIDRATGARVTLGAQAEGTVLVAND